MKYPDESDSPFYSVNVAPDSVISEYLQYLLFAPLFKTR